MNTTTELRHPKPAEGQIAGSQPSDEPLALPHSGGLAVATGAEKSAPSADEKDIEIQDLKADIVCLSGRVKNLQDELESVQNAHRIATSRNNFLESENARLTAMIQSRGLGITAVQNLARRAA